MIAMEKIKHQEPEHFHSMVKMHLSFLLDLNTDDCDCSFIYDKPVRRMSASKKSYKTKSI